jgi:hypothetical protein
MSRHDATKERAWRFGAAGAVLEREDLKGRPPEQRLEAILARQLKTARG